MRLRPTVAAAATYYVSAAGNDSNSGLAASAAWKTLDRVNRGNYSAGSTILLAAGQTFVGGITLNDVQGTAQAPVTLSSTGGGVATIVANGGRAITFNNSQGVAVRNLRLVGPGGSAPPDGLMLWTNAPLGMYKNYVCLEGLEVSGFNNGILLGGGFADVEIRRCNIHDVISNGIFSHGGGSPPTWSNKNYLISDNLVYNAVGQNDTSAKGSGILLAQVDGALVTRNVVHDCGSGGAASVGIWAYDANQVTLEHNEVYGQKSLGTDGDGFDLDGGVTNSVMQYNYSHDNVGAGYLVWQYAGASPNANNTVRYNISVNDSRGGSYYGAVSVGGSPLSKVRIYNNLLIATPTAGAGMSALALWNRDTQLTDILVANNMFYSTGGNSFLLDIGADANPFTIVNNAYFDSSNQYLFWANNINYTSLAAFRTGSRTQPLGGLSNDLVGDPLLVSCANSGIVGDPNKLKDLSNYTLRAPSRLRGAGLDLNKAFAVDRGNQDFYGTLLSPTGPFDIGIQQTGAASAPTNLLQNPGAEAGTQPWTVQQASAVPSAQVHSGATRFELKPAAVGGTAMMHQSITGLSTGRYRASVYGWGTGTATINGLAVYDLAWSPLATDWSLPLRPYPGQQYALDFQLSGTGTQTGAIVFYNFTASTPGASLALDDFAVVKQP
jgi:hypothetical protein